ncbi:MAG: hypothetical protein JWR61_4871 [Ferruginibacter sp.]|nr:hypothetical protein [Ferruginibacter sp.]
MCQSIKDSLMFLVKIFNSINKTNKIPGRKIMMPLNELYLIFLQGMVAPPW